MAERLGVGEKTYTRWESGRSIQNKSSDNLIRLMDRSPEQFAVQEPWMRALGELSEGSQTTLGAYHRSWQ